MTRNVGRGPVPRRARDNRTLARDRPSRYGTRAGNVGRGPVPRHARDNRTLARDRPSRYGPRAGNVGRGPVPRHCSRARLCRANSPDPDPFVIRRSQTTERKHTSGRWSSRGTGPRATMKKRPPPHRRARACPSPSSVHSNDRGGQAPALR